MLNYIRSIITSFLIAVATFVSPVKYTNVIPTPVPKTTITITITPIPTVITPSDRALRLTAFIYANISETELEKLRIKHGVKKSTNQQEIIDHAYWFDNNPAEMQKDELIMQNMINASNGRNNNQGSDIESSLNNLDQKLQQITDCQEEMGTYTDCINDNARELQDYNNCISNGFGYCSKPFIRYCFKPNCY